MEFKVLSRREIKTFFTNKKHIVISVRDPKTERAELPKTQSRLSVLDLEFNDIDWQKPSCAYITFDKNMAQEILKFVDEYKDKVDLIICQCEAGISRSAGIAGALSRILEEDDLIFFKTHIPNRLVYSTILKEYYED